MPEDAVAGFDVLVVDDDEAVRDLLAEFCRLRNHSVTTASDGRAAVNELGRSAGRYRLVLTDVSMPGADGFEVLAAARAADPTSYVVIITGYASMDSAIQAVRLGANDYLAKPFTLGQIDVTLERVREREAARADRLNGTPGRLVDELHGMSDRIASVEQAVAMMTNALADLSDRLS